MHVAKNLLLSLLAGIGVLLLAFFAGYFGDVAWAHLQVPYVAPGPFETEAAGVLLALPAALVAFATTLYVLVRHPTRTDAFPRFLRGAAWAIGLALAATGAWKIIAALLRLHEVPGKNEVFTCAAPLLLLSVGTALLLWLSRTRLPRESPSTRSFTAERE